MRTRAGVSGLLVLLVGAMAWAQADGATALIQAAQSGDAGAQERGDGLLDALHRFPHLTEATAHHLAALALRLR